MSNFLRYQINEENLYIYDNDSGLIFNINKKIKKRSRPLIEVGNEFCLTCPLLYQSC